MDDAIRSELMDEVALAYAHIFENQTTYDRKEGYGELAIRVVPLSTLKELYDGDHDGPVGRFAFWLQEVDSYRYALTNFEIAPTAFGPDYDDFCALVESTVTESEKVADIIRELATEMDEDEATQFVFGGLCMAAQAIVNGRLVFGGRRYGLTETIFQTAKDGLFVFGFDEDCNELLCYRPAS